VLQLVFIRLDGTTASYDGAYQRENLGDGGGGRARDGRDANARIATLV